MCAIAAPTGLAAFNVGGITIHRLFQLPIEHSGKAATYWSLPKTSEKVMKTTLCNVKLFINIHGLQSQLSIHVLQTRRIVRWGRMVWITKHVICR